MNPDRNEVEITLSGQTYLLRMTWECASRITQATNKSLTQLALALGDGALTIVDAYHIIKNGLEASGNSIPDDELKDILLTQGEIVTNLQVQDFILTGSHGGNYLDKLHKLDDGNKKNNQSITTIQ